MMAGISQTATDSTEGPLPKIEPRLILGLPVEQFSYIMLGIGAAAPAIFIITVVIVMQCYKRQKKKKLLRMQMRYQMAQNSMDNGEMFPSHRRWTDNDVVFENPVLVSKKDLSTSNSATRSIGGSVVIMNGSIRNNPLPDFHPQQSESEPNVFFTDVSIPILQLNGKPVKLNDANEVCSIRSSSSSTRSNFELGPSGSTMHTWGFSPTGSLLGWQAYENAGEFSGNVNPMSDELEGCDKQNMFFEQTTLENENNGNVINTDAILSDRPNEIQTTAVVIENLHVSDREDIIAQNVNEELSDLEHTAGNSTSAERNAPSVSESPGADSIESGSGKDTSKYKSEEFDSKHSNLKTITGRFRKKSEKTTNSVNSKVDTEKVQDSKTKFKDGKVMNSELKTKADDIVQSDENDNEENKLQRQSWLYTSYVNKAYDPEPVESDRDDIITTAIVS